MSNSAPLRAATSTHLALGSGFVGGMICGGFAVGMLLGPLAGIAGTLAGAILGALLDRALARSTAVGVRVSLTRSACCCWQLSGLGVALTLPVSCSSAGDDA